MVVADISLRQDVYTRQVGFDLAVLDPERELLHILNAVGAVVWHSISPDRSLRQIADAVCLAYDLPSELEKQVFADVVYFIERLRQASLLEKGESLEHGEELVSSGGTNETNESERTLSTTIPDREISRVDASYQPPSIKTLTLEEVNQLNNIPGGFTPRFADTWHPDQPK